MTTNYGARPGLTIDADRERSIRAASIASGTAEERSIARTLLAELDEERAAHGETMALLADACSLHAATLAALEAIVARLDGVFDHPALVARGPLASEPWVDVYRFAEAAIAQARGSRDGVHCACGNVVGADGVRCVECAR